MKTKHIILAATLAVCGIMTACNPGNQAKHEEAVQADTIASDKPALLVAVDRYLVDSIASNYASGEFSIPCVPMTCVTSTDSTDVKVWGDFWVFNYNKVGDTLKCVSGGNHPGLMHMRKVGDNYEVFAFEQVEDGAGNEASARKIFGENYDAFNAVNSDEQYRAKALRDAIIDYVKQNGLTAKYCQDYGRPAVSLE